MQFIDHFQAYNEKEIFHHRLWFHQIFIPLRAKQVSKANLRSEQGGINFTPFVLSLPNAKKKKKKKIKFPIWIVVSSKMSVCCLSVVCLLSVCCLSVCLSVCDEFVPNYLLNRLSDWVKIFFTKTRENVYLRISILKFRGQHSRVKALGLRP